MWILFANGGVCAPPNPPLFRSHRCLQKRTSVKSSPPSMLALKKSIADRQVVATIDAGAKNKHLVIAMWIIYVCTRGRLCGSFCLQMGGAAPPQPPRFERPWMLALKNKHQLVTMWIVYVCSRRILCGSLCLQMAGGGGGCAPPTPPLLRAIDACNKEQASSRCRHQCFR